MLFSSLRERLGADQCAVRVPPGSAPDELWPRLPSPIRCERAPAGVRYAINDAWAADGAQLSDGDRVAIILPVSGG
jgi:molybdopterin converting factor small subunit